MIVVVSSGALVGIGIRRGGRKEGRKEKREITVSGERPCRRFYNLLLEVSIVVPGEVGEEAGAIVGAVDAVQDTPHKIVVTDLGDVRVTRLKRRQRHGETFLLRV